MWKKTQCGGIVPKFGYASDWKPIEANPHELKGPGWEAKIEGTCKVSEVLATVVDCDGQCCTIL